MTRKNDLEKHIRQSYQIAHEYEKTKQFSSDAMEKMRCVRGIQRQLDLLTEYFQEYGPLVGMHYSPSDIRDIYRYFRSNGGVMSAWETAKPGTWACQFCGAENYGRKCIDCNAPKDRSEQRRTRK